MSQFDEKDGGGYVYVLTVGSTGVGKSSHLKILTGDNKIKAADRNDSNSCTEGTSVHTSIHPALSKYKFIDTQGAQDTKTEESDILILRKSQKKLYELKADKIKILWFIRRSAKMMPILQQQAHYINAFELPNARQSIWKSVYIIVKEPGERPSNLREGVAGALAAIANISPKVKKEQISVNYTGHTCLEWLCKEDQLFYELDSKESLKRKNVLDSNDILLKLTDVLNNELDYYTIFFRNQKCMKCGWTGDSRFADAKCHGNVIKYHPKQPIMKHSGKKCRKHRMVRKKVKYHGKQYDPKVHSGKLTQKHKNNKIFYQHPASKLKYKHFGKVVSYLDPYTTTVSLGDACGRCHSTNLELYVATNSYWGLHKTCSGCRLKGEKKFIGQNCNKRLWKDEKYAVCLDCKANEFGIYRCELCIYEKFEEKVKYETKYKWDCCDQPSERVNCVYKTYCSNCDNFINAPGVAANGCVGTYSCCGTETDNKEDEDWKGCIYEWQCCKRDDKYELNGCSFACCKQKIGSTQGCSSKLEDKYPCCGRSGDGCVAYYDCCPNGTTNSEGCKYYYKCNYNCNKQGRLLTKQENFNEINDEYRGCAAKCKQCDAKIGYGPGCVETVKGRPVKHEFKTM